MAPKVQRPCRLIGLLGPAVILVSGCANSSTPVGPTEEEGLQPTIQAAASAVRTCPQWSRSNPSPSTCYQALRVDELAEQALLAAYAADVNSTWKQVVPQNGDEKLQIAAAFGACGLSAAGTALLFTGVPFLAIPGISLMKAGGAGCITTALPFTLKKAYFVGKWLAAWAFWIGQRDRVELGRGAMARFRGSVGSSPVTLSISFSKVGTNAIGTLSGVCGPVNVSSRAAMSVLVQSGRGAINYAVSCVNGRWSRSGVAFATSNEYSVFAYVGLAGGGYTVSSVIDRGL